MDTARNHLLGYGTCSAQIAAANTAAGAPEAAPHTCIHPHQHTITNTSCQARMACSVHLNRLLLLCSVLAPVVVVAGPGTAMAHVHGRVHGLLPDIVTGSGSGIGGNGIAGTAGGLSWQVNLQNWLHHQVCWHAVLCHAACQDGVHGLTGAVLVLLVFVVLTRLCEARHHAIGK